MWPYRQVRERSIISLAINKKAPQIIDLQGLKFCGADESSIEHLSSLFTILQKIMINAKQ